MYIYYYSTCSESNDTIVPSYIQENNFTPLMVACTIGDSVSHVVHLLLENEANPDGDPNVSFSALVHSELVIYLLYSSDRLIADL